MSSDVAIRLEGVFKSFPIYEKPHHRLMQMLSPGPRERWFREFQALQGVDFSVRRGETVGIVGRNGSGKSTLLQIICGTLTATKGSVAVNGRVAALLELGAGFNPEFTGRENVYMNGAVLGLNRDEIDERFDDIVAFADIGEFIEQPVKSYSSGMYIRLAFAVAINVTPDILVIDEALSVGDEAFQRKCFARINAIRDAGATVLFVSHSAGAVIELCDRAVLMDRGELLAHGSAKFVVSRYHKLLYAPVDNALAIREGIRAEHTATLALTDEHPGQEDGSSHSGEDAAPADPTSEAYLDEGMVPQSTLRYQSRGASIKQPHIETLQGRRVNVLKAGEDYVYVYSVTFQTSAVSVRFGMMIKTVTGLELGGAITSPHGASDLVVVAGQEMTVRLRFRAMLAPGVYFMNAGVTAHDLDGDTYLDRLIDVEMFRVMPVPDRLATGVVDFHVSASVQSVTGALT